MGRQLVEKASQRFTSADVKAAKSVFCRGLCAAESTLRGVSVELSAIREQPGRRAKPSRKSGKATSSTISGAAALCCRPAFPTPYVSFTAAALAQSDRGGASDVRQIQIKKGSLLSGTVWIQAGGFPLPFLLPQNLGWIKKRTRTLFRKESGSGTNCLVDDTGLEPVTPCTSSRCSSQLS